MKHGIVSRITQGMFPYQGWPTVCKDENGVLYAASSGHRLSHVCPFGKNYLFISRDDGETWTQPMIINDSQLDDRDAGILHMGNGEMLMTYFSHNRSFYYQPERLKRYHEKLDPLRAELALGLLNAWKSISDDDPTVDQGGAFVRLSHDGGMTWDKAIQVPLTSPHGPTLLANGKLLYLGKYRPDGSYPQIRSYPIVAYESADGGRTWKQLAQLTLPEGADRNDWHEPHAVELPDGSILGGIRVHMNTPEIKPFTIYLTYSYDGGTTWTVPTPTGISGSPPHFLVHSSGAIVMTYARRDEKPGEYARISYDNGKTFGNEIVLDDRAEDWDLGYPSTVELSDGSLMTVYYQKQPGDRYCSILYTKWTLEEGK